MAFSPVRKISSSDNDLDASFAPPSAEAAALRDDVLRRLTYTVCKDKASASPRDWFIATALATRDRVVASWLATTKRNYQQDRRRVYYLSLEFLVGRLLIDGLTNLGLTEPMREALAGLGVDLDKLRALEPDAALGNGGLGRLAACFMDSMATLEIAAVGYGIRYDHGLFRQTIKDGWQHRISRGLAVLRQPMGISAPRNPIRHRLWRPCRSLAPVRRHRSRMSGGRPRRSSRSAYDTPVVGWRGKHVNTLRLWSARSPDPLRLDAFNRGRSRRRAQQIRCAPKSISKVLYPSDSTPAGQELRLRQEYFFASASLQDLIRRHHEAVRRYPQARRQGRDPAQRHPSGDRASRN